MTQTKIHIRTPDGLYMLCGLSLEESWNEDRNSRSVIIEWTLTLRDALAARTIAYTAANQATCQACREAYMHPPIGTLSHHVKVVGVLTEDAAGKQEALDAYWAAETPDEERIAYVKMIELGMKPAYGENTGEH